MLFDTIKSDRIQAMRNKERTKLAVLDMVQAGATATAKKAGRLQPSDDDTLRAIRKELESSRENAKNASIAVEKRQVFEAEMRVLESYLPAPIDSEETERLVNAAIADGASSIQAIMAAMDKSVLGRYDRAAVAKLAKQLLC